VGKRGRGKQELAALEYLVKRLIVVNKQITLQKIEKGIIFTLITAFLTRHQTTRYFSPMSLAICAFPLNAYIVWIAYAASMA